MPRKKMRTVRAIAKRFWRTGSGKVMRRRANLRHLLSGKKANRKRSLTPDVLVSPTDMRRLGSLIP